MLSPYLKRIVIDVLLATALILGLFYAYKVFIDFLISLFHFEGTMGTLNIASISYCIQRTLFIIIPMVMLTVLKNFPKMKIFKAMFYTIGITYLLGNTWIIYYVLNNSPADLFYGSIPVWFQYGRIGMLAENAWNNLVSYQFSNALVFNYLIWDSYDLFGVIFSTIQGILYIRLAKVLDTSRKIVMKNIILVSVLSFVFPWAYNIVIRKRFIFTNDWANRNILLIFESLFIVVALKFAASSRSFWHDVIW